ncbi:MAG: hypothetical protein EA381_04810 [Planctomycetaceae bacterium]|nr:MAG: hypothetical protein EA381_04810 [Planctomycetaceae bacterium]
MRLQSQGEISWTLAVLLALAVGSAVAWFYRRETRDLDRPWSWGLPLLRAAAIALVLLMLVGPVFRWQRVIGSVPRIDVFVDFSGSMLATDELAGEVIGEEPAGRSGRTRLQRSWDLLTGEGRQPGWLEAVRQTHHVAVHLVAEDDARLVWDSNSDQPIPESPLAAWSQERSSSGGQFTNLGDPIAARLLRGDGPSAGKRAAVVMMSDGQHNAGSPPAVWARLSGDAGVPVHAIGLGGFQEPRDVGILEVSAPASVSAGGRVGGQVIFKDLADPGERVRLQITLADQVVWEQTLTSEQVPQRRVPFDFPVAPLIERLGATDEATGFERTRVTLPLSVSIDPIEGQFDARNNRLDFRVAANLRRRRLLLVDSRNRWETRYLFNLFDRDPSWQVETVIAAPRSEAGTVVRDRLEGSFPADSQSMAAYDAVIWGDCGVNAFSGEDMKRLNDFVAQGGALVFVDGDRDGLRSLARSPAGQLLPVKWSDRPAVVGVRGLRPTVIGSEQTALKLAAADGVESERADIAAAASGGRPTDANAVWEGLQPPTELRAVEPLPGAEVWLETIPGEASDPFPALVIRRFGGGQVVYLPFDQTWRWRYRVADRYHNRFWNQLLEEIMQPPFEVRDQYVALAVGSPQYAVGESATIRAQLRDAAGKPLSDVIVEAVLQDASGAVVQTVLLRGSDGDRGIYEGRTAPLPVGSFDVSLRAAGYQASQAVRTSLLVVAPPDRESSRLAQDADLLVSLATASGGVYADETEAERVWQAIEPLSDGRIETRRYALAESFPWFFAVLGLLTAEWWFRKKTGLV